MENDLMHLALQGNKDCMLDVARCEVIIDRGNGNEAE